MSWRTKSHYVGLSAADKRWLKKFDRDWDTVAMGRSHVDAFSVLCTSIAKAASLTQKDPLNSSLEADLELIAQLIERFTAPRPFRKAWRIYLLLKSGKRTQVHFIDRSDAIQAHTALKDLCLMVTRT